MRSRVRQARLLQVRQARLLQVRRPRLLLVRRPLLAPQVSFHLNALSVLNGLFLHNVFEALAMILKEYNSVTGPGDRDRLRLFNCECEIEGIPDVQLLRKILYRER